MYTGQLQRAAVQVGVRGRSQALFSRLFSEVWSQLHPESMPASTSVDGADVIDFRLRVPGAAARTPWLVPR